MEVILLSDILIAVIAVIWLFVATVQDIKKREVANWLNFSLLIIALGIRAIASVLSLQPYYFLSGIIVLAVFFIIANIFYYARIFAGGDSKLLIALAVAFATNPTFLAGKSLDLMNLQIPFLATFIINILLIGSVYGIVWSTALAFKNKEAFRREFKKLGRDKKKINLAFFLFFTLFLSISLMMKEATLLTLGFIFLLFPFLFIFVKAVENSCMIKEIKPEKLTEGDWLFKPIKLGKKIIIPKWEGLNKKEIALLKKSRIKRVRIKQGLPFVPVFLIALITSFFTNLVLFLIKSLV